MRFMGGLTQKNGYGHFGNLSVNYAKARKEFPDESVSYIFSRLNNEKPYILDIGCGTGIATEQLRKKGAKVIGTDIDPDMIKQAQVRNLYNIEYLVAPARQQPFASARFDAVTAFSAFHWFANKKVLDEIKRILKPRGMFFAINKNEAGDFKKEYKEVLKEFIDQELPNAKNGYDPARLLKENELSFVKEKNFPLSEFFTPEEAKTYIQSVSLWNLVPDNKKYEALKAVTDYLLRRADANGKIERKLGVVVVSGKVEKH